MAGNFRQRRADQVRGAALSSLILAILLLSGGAGAQDSGPLIVGIAAPLTGDSGAIGPELRNGVELALASLDAGSVLGRRIQLETLDDACDATKAVTVARRLASMHAALVVGHVCSDATLAAAPIYAEAGIVQITPASTNPAVTEQGIATLFRTIGRDDHQGEAAAALIAVRWPEARLVILDDGQGYGRGLADALTASLMQRGFPVALRRGYDRNGGALAETVSAIKAQHADLVYLSGDELDAAVLARACRASGVTAQFLGGDALINPRYKMAAAAAAEGTIFSFPPDLARRPEAAAALARFRAAGVEPDGYALLAYAALQVWVQAAADAGSIEASAVSHSMHKRSFDTAIGPVRFDSAGDIEGQPAQFVWYRWENGVVRPLTEQEGSPPK